MLSLISSRVVRVLRFTLGWRMIIINKYIEVCHRAKMANEHITVVVNLMEMGENL
jgi:hypothetical protein